LPRNALQGEDGEGERETRPERETQANVRDRTKLGRTLSSNSRVLSQTRKIEILEP